MKTSRTPSEFELHAFADGALDEIRRAQVAAYLDGHPVLAATVRGWRRHAERLRAELAGVVLREGAAQLDPARIRGRLRTRALVRAGLAALWLAAAAMGVIGGWRLGAGQGEDASMLAAVDAYRVFAGDPRRPVELGAEDANRLQHWLSNRLGRPLAFPDLRTEGFQLLGGRLLAAGQGPAAWLVYQDRQGRRIGLYIVASDGLPQGGEGARSDGGLVTRYWFNHGYGYAVTLPADDTRGGELEQAIRSGS